MNLEISLKQARRLLESFGGCEETSMTVTRFKRPVTDEEGNVRPAGLYVYCTDYPEEGSMYLGPGLDEEETEPPRERECRMCNGVGHLLVDSWDRPKKYVPHDCPNCNGTGWVRED